MASPPSIDYPALGKNHLNIIVPQHAQKTSESKHRARANTLQNIATLRAVHPTAKVDAG